MDLLEPEVPNFSCCLASTSRLSARTFVTMSAKEPHEVLDVAATAGIAEIRQAYRQMVDVFAPHAWVGLLTSFQALKWHPDRHVHDDKDHAISMFAEVSSLVLCG
jgi:hypothetical protein